MVNYSSKLLKGAGIIFAASILSSAFAYFIRILLAKKLSVEEFGLFFAVYSAVLTVGAIKGLGTGASVSKFIPEFEVSNEQNKIKSVLSFIFLFNIFSSIVVFIIFYFFPENIINSYFKSEMAKSLLLWLFVFVSIDSLSKVVSGYFLSRHFSFIFSLRDLIVRAVIFLSLLLVVDLNNIMVALMHIGASLLGLGINTILFLRYFSFFKYRFYMNRKLIKRVFTFSLPLAVKSLFGILMARIDNLMLVFFRPLAEVALYNTIQPTAELLLLFARPFGKILFPMGSELLALDNKKGICFLLKRVHKYLLILFVPALIVILLFSGFLLQLLFGESYSGGALGLQILIFGFLFTGLNIPSYSILLGIGRSKEATYAVIGTNFLNLVLNIILIPLLGKFDIGYIGAILATVFSQLLLFLWVWAYIKRYISYSFPIRDWFLISIIGIALLLIGLIIAQRIYNIYLQIVLVGLVLLILYPLCLWILNVISRKEINDMVNLVKK